MVDPVEYYFYVFGYALCVYSFAILVARRGQPSDPESMVSLGLIISCFILTGAGAVVSGKLSDNLLIILGAPLLGFIPAILLGLITKYLDSRKV